VNTYVAVQDWELLCSASLTTSISEREEEMALRSHSAIDLKYPGLEHTGQDATWSRKSSVIIKLYVAKIDPDSLDLSS